METTEQLQKLELSLCLIHRYQKMNFHCPKNIKYWGTQ